MMYIKVTRSDTRGSYVQPIDQLRQTLDAELDGIEVGVTVTIEVVEMTKAEYEALSEFEGW